MVFEEPYYWQAVTDTLEYTRDSMNYKPEHHYIMEGACIREYMHSVGFTNIFIGGDGTLNSSEQPSSTLPFFKGTYRSFPCVNEVIATK